MTKMIILFYSLLISAMSVIAADSLIITEPTTGITVTVYSTGQYKVIKDSPAWSFTGTTESALSGIIAETGTDSIGNYREIVFTYTAETKMSSSIRTYANRPVVFFARKMLSALNGSMTSRFPVLSIPEVPYKMAFEGKSFSIQTSFGSGNNNGPWVGFDNDKNTFIISAADHFPNERLNLAADGSVYQGWTAGSKNFPANYTQKTVLAIDKGINAAFTTWGSALGDLYGKKMPDIATEPMLRDIGYWTDNGCYYYYKNWDKTKGCDGTLLAVRDHYAQNGLPMGYMQIDSYWYPKGYTQQWQYLVSGGGGYGIYELKAHPALFTNGDLGLFHTKLGKPLAVHSRWIDTASPYRDHYIMSKNVSIDPKWWNDRMADLKNWGVISYLQDWMTAACQPLDNLTDWDIFLDLMSQSGQSNGITLQYGMHSPFHNLQQLKYQNHTYVRISDDGQRTECWDQFLFNSMFVSSLRVYPWSDPPDYKVGGTQNTGCMIMSTLSGGPVGTDDQIGKESKTNILKVARPDAVIVKPDAPIRPTDQTIFLSAKNGGYEGSTFPMVANTYVDHNGIRTAYIFAYSRASTTQLIRFSPDSVGVSGKTYVYDFIGDTGSVVAAGSSFSATVNANRAFRFFIVAPIRASGMACIGDVGKFVTLGKQRISSFTDDPSSMTLSIAYAEDEGPVTISGYAPVQPVVTVSSGSIGAVSYNATSKLFSVAVSHGANNQASITMRNPLVSTIVGATAPLRAHRAITRMVSSGIFVIPRESSVEKNVLSVYDLCGRLVCRSVTGRGPVDLRKDLGLPEGAYIVRMVTTP